MINPKGRRRKYDISHPSILRAHEKKKHQRTKYQLGIVWESSSRPSYSCQSWANLKPRNLKQGCTATVSFSLPGICSGGDLGEGTGRRRGDRGEACGGHQNERKPSFRREAQPQRAPPNENEKVERKCGRRAVFAS